ncbi:MAG: prolipoprotein diacylglyceryl transferase family protein [Minicystis sp.]
MRPVFVAWLLRHGLPGWITPDYVVLVGVAGLLGAMVALRLAEQDKAFLPFQARALALGYVAALFGGYVLEALRALPAALAQGSWMPILGAGRAAYGGLLFGLLAPLLYLRLHKQPLAPFLDRITPLLGITFACVRTGCFLAGCDYGRPTASWLGLRFPPGSPAAVDHADLGWVRAGAPSLPVHATQLYEAALGLLATALAYTYLRRGARDGRAFATWIATYAIGRFALELIRGDGSRGIYGGLSSAQYISMALVVAVLLWTRRGQARFTTIAAPLVLLLSIPAGRALAQPKPPTSAGKPAASAKPGAGAAKPPPGSGKPAASASSSAVAPPPPAPPPEPESPALSPAPPPPPAATVTPEAPPPPEVIRHVTLRMAVAPALVFGNPNVPTGGVIEIAGTYRVPISRAARFEVGLEPRLFRNVEASHVSLGVPLMLVFGASKRVEIDAALVINHTWILFDSPFFATTNAWGTRFELGLQFPLGSRGLLGVTPLAGNVMSSQTIGVVTTWEPRFWGGVVL